MKSDLTLQKDVADELAMDASVDAADIGVAAKDGVVTLTGMAPTYADKIAAEKAAKRVSGVQAIASEIQVDLRPFHQRTDTEIASAAVNALAWEGTLPRDAVMVKVAQGWLTLEGRVDSYFQRANAERAVNHLIGVRGITNLIAVVPRVKAVDVEAKIRKAFERSAELDADRVIAIATNGTVTLRGAVRSWVEHDDATRAAWSVPGVTKVDNLIAVGT